MTAHPFAYKGGIVKLILLFRRRQKIIKRYLAVKRENYFLRERNNKLEQQIALYKLQEIAVRKKALPQ